MSKTGDFFLFCAGVDRDILAECPTDRNKYMGIGATIFFTGVLAFFSSGYALYTVFDSWLAAVVFGLIWGLMIFNLDRYIVMSMKSRGSWWRDAWIALPRLALAVLLALVISKPLELKIFEKEIRAEIVQMEQEIYKKQEDGVSARFTGQIDTVKSDITALKQEIARATAARDSFQLMALQEADGTGGSRQKNLGPIYRAKQARAEAAQQELNQTMARLLPVIQQKEQQAAQLEANRKQQVDVLDRSTRYDGLAARIDALSRLSSRSLAILYASLFIMLLFVAVETAPIMVKLMSTRSPYDYVLHQREQVYEMEHLEKTTLLRNQAVHKTTVDTETTRHRTAADIEVEKARIDSEKKAAMARVAF